MLLALWGAWLLHRASSSDARWFLAIATWAVIAPFLMNTAGWLLTENGRQPWIVQGLMKTEDGVSPSVSATEIWISLFVFILLYAALATIAGLPDGPLRPAAAARRGRGRPRAAGLTTRRRVIRRQRHRGRPSLGADVLTGY